MDLFGISITLSSIYFFVTQIFPLVYVGVVPFLSLLLHRLGCCKPSSDHSNDPRDIATIFQASRAATRIANASKQQQQTSSPDATGMTSAISLTQNGMTLAELREHGLMHDLSPAERARAYFHGRLGITTERDADGSPTRPKLAAFSLRAPMPRFQSKNKAPLDDGLSPNGTANADGSRTEGDPTFRYDTFYGIEWRGDRWAPPPPPMSHAARSPRSPRSPRTPRIRSSSPTLESSTAALTV